LNSEFGGKAPLMAGISIIKVRHARGSLKLNFPELSLKNKRALPHLIFYMARFTLLRHHSFLYGAIM